MADERVKALALEMYERLKNDDFVKIVEDIQNIHSRYPELNAKQRLFVTIACMIGKLVPVGKDKELEAEFDRMLRVIGGEEYAP